jgi:membrane protein CcdC involved in cytochrome C biogenesis
VMAKFQLKIIIIRVLTKKTQETQADVQIPPLSLADSCLFLFFLLYLTPIIRSSSRTIASAVDCCCCVGGQIGRRFL